MLYPQSEIPYISSESFVVVYQKYPIHFSRIALKPNAEIRTIFVLGVSETHNQAIPAIDYVTHTNTVETQSIVVFASAEHDGL